MLVIGLFRLLRLIVSCAWTFVYLLSVLQWCMVVRMMVIDAKGCEKSEIGARGHTTVNEFRYLLG